jgi:HEAT repeat protein
MLENVKKSNLILLITSITIAFTVIILIYSIVHDGSLKRSTEFPHGNDQLDKVYSLSQLIDILYNNELMNDVRYDAISRIVDMVNTGISAKEAVPALISIFDNMSLECNLRAKAAFALGVIGPDAKMAVPSLVKYLEGPDRIYDARKSSYTETMLYVIYTALAKIRYSETAAFPALLDMRSNDPLLRACTLHLLGVLADVISDNKIKQNVVHHLTLALDDIDLNNRRLSLIALSKYHEMALPAIPKINSLLDDKDELVRKSAAEAIKAIK